MITDLTIWLQGLRKIFRTATGGYILLCNHWMIIDHEPRKSWPVLVVNLKQILWRLLQYSYYGIGIVLWNSTMNNN